MDGFFGNDEEKDECAWHLVDILYKGLINRGLIARKPDTPKWRREFRAALDDGLVNADEMELTLVWYLNNLSRMFMPQAYSARGFLEKYPAIRRKFLDDQKAVAPPKVNKIREATTSTGLVPPPEGADDDLLDWYDKIIEEGESYPGETARYAEECERRHSCS